MHCCFAAVRTTTGLERLCVKVAKHKRTKEEKKKSETAKTLIQRIKEMKPSKVKKATDPVYSKKGGKFAHSKEAN